MTSLAGDGRIPHHRTMSTSVRRLQDALNMHLDLSEKTEFVEILNQFHINRDISQFVRNLKLLLDTPAKTQLIALIKKVIPKADLEDFEKCLRFRSRKFDTMPAKQSKKLQRSRPPLTAADTALHLKSKKHRKDKSAKSKDENKSESSKNTLIGRVSETSKSCKSSNTRGTGTDTLHIAISEPGGAGKGFGFSIRGGIEYGIGIYVSLVDNGGMAEQQGLVPGDLLVEVNQLSFDKISHVEAAKIIRASQRLDMTICRVGRIPGSFVVHQMYKWVNDGGRPVSPPPELEQLGHLDTVGRKSGFALLKGSDERKINVTVANGESLGVMIRGGREFGLGIYISGVDPLSLADAAGMKIGEQILDVNGRSFLDITHADAVRILKKSKYLMFTTKDIGKLPYARTKIDQTSWTRNNEQRKQRHRTTSQNSDSTLTQASSKNTMFRKGIGSQLMYNTSISTKWDVIENQALQLLNDIEQGTLRYYLSEYQAGFITVDGLAMATFELLNTKAKMSMMSEIRNWVRARDLDRFDMLLQRRETRQKQGFIPPSQSTYSLDRGEHHMPDRLQHQCKIMSAPASRAATVRERSTRVHRRVAEWELEPLRQAIEQIEEDYHPQSENEHRHSGKPLSARLRSYSTEQLNSPSPNLLKTSLASGRSMSVETLTPVYIDTTSDLPPSPRHRSNSVSSSRSKSTSAAQRQRAGNSYSHRQRSGSNNSTLRRRYRSVEDIRTPVYKRKTTPYPSRRGSAADIRSNLASASYTHLRDAEFESPRMSQSYTHLRDVDSESPRRSQSYTHLRDANTDHHRSTHTTNIVHADIHEQPRAVDGSPSDDSGVEVNGHNGNEPQNNRVTISSDNPVNIDDVLQSRSFIIPRNNHSNHSTLTNRSTRSHPAIATLLTNQTIAHPNDSISATSSPKHSPFHRNANLRPPIEIRINDGDGSIDTMSLQSHTSPRFVNQSKRSYMEQSYRRSSRREMFDTDDEDYDDDDEDDEEEQGTWEISSEIGDNSEFYVSPLDRVLDKADSYNYLEAKQIVDAQKKYGNIPLYIIPVYKTKPTLGMAIEGGANTRQPVPRVINLQPGGSAYESGGLKVGHKILEVNGKSLLGMEHITAAKTVAEAFKNNQQDNMELLVTESDAHVKLTR